MALFSSRGRGLPYTYACICICTSCLVTHESGPLKSLALSNIRLRSAHSSSRLAYLRGVGVAASGAWGLQPLVRGVAAWVHWVAAPRGVRCALEVLESLGNGAQVHWVLDNVRVVEQPNLLPLHRRLVDLQGRVRGGGERGGKKGRRRCTTSSHGRWWHLGRTPPLVCDLAAAITRR